MANLTASRFAATKDADGVVAMPMAAVKAYVGSAAFLDRTTGYVTGTWADSKDLVFCGIFTGSATGLGSLDNSAGSAGAIVAMISRQRIVSMKMSSPAITDVGQSVYFSDNQTVTKTAGAVYAGRIVSVGADAASVEVDTTGALAGIKRRVVNRIAQFYPLAIGTFRSKLYACPTGATALIKAAKYGYSVKPNFGTSCALYLETLKATVRATALSTASVDVNNTTPAVDTPTAMTLSSTAANLALTAGQELEASAVAAGTLAAAGDPYVSVEILEIGGSND